MKEKLLAREKECFDFLKSIPQGRKFILIGGYAVSSYGFPRFSVDLDIVIPKNEFKFFENLCKEKEFTLSIEKSDIDLTYAGEFKRYKKKELLPVSVDLMINSVKSRQTSYSYSFSRLIKNSVIKELRGWHPDNKVQTRIVDKEMLIALKINSMRTADKRDIIMLCYNKPDIDKIKINLKGCPENIITTNLNELDKLFSSKYNDSIKGVFTITDDVLAIAIKNTKKMIEMLI